MRCLIIASVNRETRLSDYCAPSGLSETFCRGGFVDNALHLARGMRVRHVKVMGTRIGYSNSVVADDQHSLNRNMVLSLFYYR